MAIDSVVLFTSSQIGTLNATGAEFIVDRACNFNPSGKRVGRDYRASQKGRDHKPAYSKGIYFCQ